MTVLLDNTVLSNFSIIRHPDLVRAAFVEHVGTTEQAFREMQDGVAEGDRFLHAMVAAGYRSPVATLQDILS